MENPAMANRSVSLPAAPLIVLALATITEAPSVTNTVSTGVTVLGGAVGTGATVVGGGAVTTTGWVVDVTASSPPPHAAASVAATAADTAIETKRTRGERRSWAICRRFTIDTLVRPIGPPGPLRSSDRVAGSDLVTGSDFRVDRCEESLDRCGIEFEVVRIGALPTDEGEPAGR